jgi:hypothetical protein
MQVTTWCNGWQIDLPIPIEFQGIFTQIFQIFSKLQQAELALGSVAFEDSLLTNSQLGTIILKRYTKSILNLPNVFNIITTTDVFVELMQTLKQE